MKKIITFFFLLFFSISLLFAVSKEEHNAWLEQIIIGGDLRKETSSAIDEKTGSRNLYTYQIPRIKYALPQEELKKIEILEQTLLLVMDQHGNFDRNIYVDYFNSLNIYFHKPNWFPSGFEKIAFPNGKVWNYEKQNHMGWNKWTNNSVMQERKKLLKNVVKKIFPDLSSKELYNFCIFLCDIHILGDIFGDVEALSVNKKEKKQINFQVSSEMRMNIGEISEEFISCLPYVIGMEADYICSDIKRLAVISNGYLNGKSLRQLGKENYFQYIHLAGRKDEIGINNYTSTVSTVGNSIQNILYLKVSELLIQKPYFKNAFPELCKIRGFDYKDYKNFCRNEKNWDKFIKYEDKYSIINEEIDRTKLRRRISEVYGKDSKYFINHNLEAAHILPGNLDHDNIQIKAAREIVSKSIGINHPANGVMLPNDYPIADLYYVKKHHGSGGYVHSENFLEKLALDIQNAAAPYKKNLQSSECKEAVAEVLMNAQKHLLTKDTNHNY